MPHSCMCMPAFRDCRSVYHSLQLLFHVNELKLVGQKQAGTDPAHAADLIADA